MTKKEQEEMLFDTLITEIRRMASEILTLANMLEKETADNYRKERIYKPLMGINGKPQEEFDDKREII